jgi:hypothetical protein
VNTSRPDTCGFVSRCAEGPGLPQRFAKSLALQEPLYAIFLAAFQLAVLSRASGLDQHIAEQTRLLIQLRLAANTSK